MEGEGYCHTNKRWPKPGQAEDQAVGYVKINQEGALVRRERIFTVGCRSDLLKPDATGSSFSLQQANGLGYFQAPISRKKKRK
jgi:hypothetical protein